MLSDYDIRQSSDTPLASSIQYGLWSLGKYLGTFDSKAALFKYAYARKMALDEITMITFSKERG